MNPADILRKNHVFLKEKLDVDNCLDNLFQQGVITEQELDICHSKQSRPEKCEYLLALLRRKEVEEYKIFCFVLDKISQKFVKEKLDSTATGNESISLVYVNKHELEEKYRETITVLEQRNSCLMDEIEKKNKDISGLVCEHEKYIEDLKTKHSDLISSERDKMLRQISILKEDLRNEHETKLQAERSLVETRQQLQNLENDTTTLEKELREVQDKYASITSSVLPELRRNRLMEHNQLFNKENEDYCGVCHGIVNSDEEKIFVLKCLHVICHNCLKNYQCSSELQCSKCHIRSGINDVRVDTARKNKVSLDSVKTTMRCTFNKCHEGKMALCYCLDCERSLCSKCQFLHEQTTICTSHKTFGIEEMENVPVKKLLKATTCRKHPSKVVELYDTDCSMSICHICTQEDHKNHNMICVDRAYEQLRLSFDEVTADLEGRRTDTERKLEELKNHEDKLDDKEKCLMENIAHTREKLTLLMLHRERDVRDEIFQTFNELRRTLSVKRNSLQDVHESLNTTTRFIKRITELCTKSEFLDFEDMVKAKAKLDLTLELPELEERDTQIKISLQGLRALESQIRSFLCLYGMHDNQREVPDDMLTSGEFQQRLAQWEQELSDLTNKLAECERDLQEMENAKIFETMRVEEYKKHLDEEKNKFHLEKHTLMLKVQRMEVQIQEERSYHAHLGTRCSELEEKLHKLREEIKTEKLENEKKQKLAQAEINRIKKSYGQLEMTMDQTVICVGRHRSESESSCLVVCPRLAFSQDRLNNVVGSIVQENVLMNAPLDNPVQNARGTTQPLRRYCGTTSSVPIFPAPNRLHEHPIFWELAGYIELNKELLSSNIIFETGVIGESSLDKNPLAYRDSLAWCIILRFCTKHRSICTQIWQKSVHVNCFPDSMPNRRGASVTVRYGGILHATRGKLKISFLDLTKDLLLGSFDLLDTELHMLVFGFPPRKDNFSVRLKLMPPREQEMTSEKKSLILRALSQMWQ